MNITLQNSTERLLFPVVGIAIGPGDMDSITKVVSSISEDSNIAYVIIIQQHSTEDPDNFSEIISHCTNLNVSEIIGAPDFAPNNIYVIPINTNLVAREGALQLHQRTRLDRADQSLDLFFGSLAQVYKSAAVGVILSGTGFDGIKGFNRLKQIGAVTIAQDPQTAAFRELPQNIIMAELADFVESPEHIAHLLKAITKAFIEVEAFGQGCCRNEAQEFIGKILGILLLRTGTDFSHYRQHLIRTRIAHRMIDSKKYNLHEYYTYLRHSTEEQDLLFDALLITVTGYFRDASFYDCLTTEVFPYLVRNTINNNIRIWIAGCASGQEAYSVAICLHEYLKRTNNLQIQVQIFASDLSIPSISKARKGIYTQQDLHYLSEDRLEDYFTERNGDYHVQNVIRDMCVFTVHNLVTNPPFSKIDLVCCNDVFTYFDAFNQNLALTSFRYALIENGVLSLGTSERLSKEQDLFGNFCSIMNLYSPLNTQGKHSVEPSVMAECILEEPKTIAVVQVYNKQVSGTKCALFGQPLQNKEEHFPRNAEVTHQGNLIESNTERPFENNELLIINDELKDRQRQLSNMANFAESIIEAICDPVLLIDSNSIIKSANPAFYMYFDIEQKKTRGNSFFEIGNCQWDIAELKTEIVKMQHDKSTIENFRVQVQCERIGKKIMNVNAKPLHDSASNGMFMITFKDVTEINYVYELFEAKHLELKKYNELLQTFAVAATNNIMEPLQKIQMLGKRIFDKEINLRESTAHNLQRIIFSAENINKLIEDLILYSKISFRTNEYRKTDLNLIIKKNLNDLKNIIKNKRAVIKVGPLPQLEVIPTQMQQLFTNIIFNSIQYSKEDVQPEIHIECKQPSIEEIIEIGGNPEIAFAKISIADNGIGFDKQYELQIFDPFFRLHTNDEYIGSGLGLTLVKKIASIHHGFVTASSKMHEGTKINIYIPVQQEPVFCDIF